VLSTYGSLAEFVRGSHNVDSANVTYEERPTLVKELTKPLAILSL